MWVQDTGRTLSRPDRRSYLTKDKVIALSAYEMYELHTTQEGTGTHPGRHI